MLRMTGSKSVIRRCRLDVRFARKRTAVLWQSQNENPARFPKGGVSGTLIVITNDWVDLVVVVVSRARSIVGRWTIVSRGRSIVGRWTIVSPRRNVVSRGRSIEPRAWCAAKAV